MPADPTVAALLQAAMRRRLIARDRAQAIARDLETVEGLDDLKEALPLLEAPETGMLRELLPDDDNHLTAPYTRYACLGQGRTSVTWLGADQAGRPVVIKVFHANRLAPGSPVELFIRDLKPLLGKERRYLARYLAAFPASDGRAVLIQEFVNGQDLASRGQVKGPMTEARALVTMRQVAKGLGELEDQGVVHGMLHPGNILVDGAQRARITDYGLAFGRTLQSMRESWAAESLRLQAWAAPEMFATPPKVLPSSDIYGLGCLGYWLLTMQPPFSGSADQQIEQHLGGPRPDVRRLAVDSSEITAKTILKCMQVEPSRRYRSAKDLASSLQRNLDLLKTGDVDTDEHHADGPGDSAAFDPILDDEQNPAPPSDSGSARAPRSARRPTAVLDDGDEIDEIDELDLEKL